jgi:hypothetical protein
MSYTKRQFIVAAFEEMGMADYVFDMSAEQFYGPLRRLDAMMADWNAQGIRLGYPLPTNPDDSVLADDTGVPDSANQAIILGLAVRLAPGVGKALSPDTKSLALTSYNTVLGIAMRPSSMRYPTMPSGAGNKGATGNFIVNPVDNRIEAPEESVELA